MKNRVREFRTNKELTQDELAYCVEVTEKTIKSIENGKYDVSLKLAHRLAKFFEVTIEELFLFD